MGNTIKALVVTTDGEVRAENISPEADDIRRIVGGWFDCARAEHYVGYVHDEGLLIGLPINYIASVMFGRILAGDCVVVGSLNENGEYDGESYDAPEWMFTHDFAHHMRSAHNDEGVRKLVDVWYGALGFTPTVMAWDGDEWVEVHP